MSLHQRQQQQLSLTGPDSERRPNPPQKASPYLGRPVLIALLTLLVVFGVLFPWIRSNSPPSSFLSAKAADLAKWRDYTLAEAAAFVEKNGSLIVCAVSEPYFPFLNNWLISIARQKHHEKVLVVAEDYNTLYRVNERWPGHAVLIPPAPDAQSAHKFGSEALSSMADKGCPVGDKLILRGIVFHGFHGVKAEEKKLGQKFLIDIDAWMDLFKAGESDDLTDTVSYTDIYRIVKNIVEGPSHDLLESVAHEIAMTTFEKHPQISAIRVKVAKPHVAVPGAIDCLGVEILRHNKKFSAV